MKFSVLLIGLAVLMRHAARKYPAFRARLAEKNFVAQIKLMDGSRGRSFVFQDGRLRSKRGIHPAPDVTIAFKSAELAARLLTPPIDYQRQINAQKNFSLTLDGPEEVALWFTETILMAQSAGWRYGTDQGDGTLLRLTCSPADAAPHEIEAFRKAMGHMGQGWGGGFANLETLLAELTA